MDVQNKRVLVVGLARSGLAVACALARRGAVVTVTDRKPPAEFSDVLPQLLQAKVGLELGSQRVETFLRHEAIVISPGVPWDLPQLQAARQRMIPVYPEVEAAAWFLEGTLVGVTGSNGKTTTTALLGDMLKASGFPTFVGGNIGNALSLAVDHAQPGTKFVTELSSFQLEGIHEFRPHVAVMLNLSPNHLDRHPNLEAYAQAKQQIFRNQGGQDYAVLNADDPWVEGLRATVSSRPVLFSRHRELASGVFLSGGKIYYRVRHLERVLFETRDVALRGDFNLEDVLAAATAACLLGADFAAIRKAVRAFKAVEHRLEFVREIAGVDFYNNSKATSVDATLKSLEAFPRGVHLIMGGKDKGAPYAPLLPLIKERVREVLLIGAAAPVIAEQLAGRVELVQAGDLGTAVYEAFARSRPGDTVLLAPACSSFDQFKDYEERGRVFKELVKRLAREVKAGAVVCAKLPAVVTPAPSGPENNTSIRRAAGALESGSSSYHLGSDQTEAAISAAAPQDSDRNEGGSFAAAVQGASRISVDSALPHLAAASESLPTSTPEAQAETPPPAPGIGSVPEPNVGPMLASAVAGSSPGPQPLASSPEPRAPAPSPEIASRHVELTYVYEVDAVDMPESESQVLPDDEPAVSLSASVEEPLDDEALPYEARKKKSEVQRAESEVRGPKSEVQRAESEVKDTKSEVRGPKSGGKDAKPEVRGPKSGAQGAEPGAQPTFTQPKLFNGNDK